MPTDKTPSAQERHRYLGGWGFGGCAWNEGFYGAPRCGQPASAEVHRTEEREEPVAVWIEAQATALEQAVMWAHGEMHQGGLTSCPFKACQSAQAGIRNLRTLAAPAPRQGGEADSATIRLDDTFPETKRRMQAEIRRSEIISGDDLKQRIRSAPAPPPPQEPAAPVEQEGERYELACTCTADPPPCPCFCHKPVSPAPPRECEATGHECGTDTHAVGHPCPCRNCSRQELERRLAEAESRIAGYEEADRLWAEQFDREHPEVAAALTAEDEELAAKGGAIVATTIELHDLRAEVARLQRERDEIAKELTDEQESHAALQVRCYEGFASATDGIFDALSAAESKISELREAAKLGEALLNEAMHYNGYLTGPLKKPAATIAIHALRAALAEKP